MSTSTTHHSPWKLQPLAFIPLAFISACCLPWPDAKPKPSTSEHSRSASKLPAPPAALSSPADSLSARPPWAGHSGYAPQASPDLLDQGVVAEGAISDGLIACSVTSDIRETRLTRTARYPDLEATLSFGSTEIFAQNPDDAPSMVITAPLASLDPGDILRLRVKDRQLLRRRKLGTLETGYVGLPAQLEATDLHGQCVWIGRQQLEARLSAPLQDAARHTQAWSPSPTLKDDSLAPQGEGAKAADAMRSAAALVGWADPRLASLVNRYQPLWQQHHDALGRRVVKRVSTVPSGWTPVADGQAWAPAGMVDSGTIQQGLSNKKFGIVLPIQTSTEITTMGDTVGALTRLDLVDSLGQHWQLTKQSTQERNEEPHIAQNLARTGTVILAGTEGAHTGMPVLPALIRAWDGQQWIFQRVDAGVPVVPAG